MPLGGAVDAFQRDLASNCLGQRKCRSGRRGACSFSGKLTLSRPLPFLGPMLSTLHGIDGIVVNKPLEEAQTHTQWERSRPSLRSLRSFVPTSIQQYTIPKARSPRRKRAHARPNEKEQVNLHSCAPPQVTVSAGDQSVEQLPPAASAELR